MYCVKNASGDVVVVKHALQHSFDPVGQLIHTLGGSQPSGPVTLAPNGLLEAPVADCDCHR
jgi:hypothetical protein